jgi:hypothetical protein
VLLFLPIAALVSVQGVLVIKMGKGTYQREHRAGMLVEAHNPRREVFGFPRLRRLVAEHAEEGSLVGFLMDELRSFAGDGWEQGDDITLVTLQRSAP